MTTPHPRHPLVPYSRPAPPPRMASCEYAFSRSAFGKEVVKMFGRKDPGLSPCPIRPGLPHVPLHLPVCRVAPPARRPHGLGSSPAPVLGARGFAALRLVRAEHPMSTHEQHQHRRAKWPALRRLAPARSWTRAATPPSDR